MISEPTHRSLAAWSWIIVWSGLCLGTPVIACGEDSVLVDENVDERKSAILQAGQAVTRALSSPAAIELKGGESWTELAGLVARQHQICVHLFDLQFQQAGVSTIEVDPVPANGLTLQEWLNRLLAHGNSSPLWEPVCREEQGTLHLGYRPRGTPLPDSALIVAGTRIVGSVHRSSGEPAPHAVIEFHNNFHRVIVASDSNGRFEFDLPPHTESDS